MHAIATGRYLASISTGEATWIVEGDRPLAVIAQQWAEPRLLIDPATTARSVVNASGQPHVNVRYWLQSNPERVFAALRDGAPLPDRYEG